ncbi:MAG: hypothetical protein GY863_24590 [bacterium]|nr:hypothetical protein [bacterium]
MHLEKIRNNFFLRFLAAAGFFLLIWKPFSIAYMHTIVFFSDTVTGIFYPYMDIAIIDGITKFRYSNITAQQLQFSVNDIDQIFLNIIVFLSLIFSSYRIDLKSRVKHAAIGIAILAAIHIFVINMYAYTTIWDYVLSQPAELSSELMARTGTYFSKGVTDIYRRLLFNWNSWGWDVVPLLLWIPAGLIQFLPLVDRLKSGK